MTSHFIEPIGTKKLGVGVMTKNPKSNMTGTKRAGTTQKENQKRQDMEEIFKGLIPKDLINTNVPESHKPSIDKKDGKDGRDGKDLTTHKDYYKTQDTNIISKVDYKKHDSHSNVGSEISEDDIKTNQIHSELNKKTKKVLTETELKQDIYITLTETSTHIFFFTPSTSCITNHKGRKNIFYDYIILILNFSIYLLIS
jgi:hypothetical protein